MPRIDKFAVAFAAATCVVTAQPVALSPSKMSRAGTVDERFQSYNVEMVEVTGGRFWAPYKSDPAKPPEPKPVVGSQPSTPAIDPSLFRMREPIDLADPRLRKLAAALGPAYMRVSGTWANSTYFHDSDDAPPATPPSGFGGILTRRQWKGALDFARAANADVITSFAISPGVRDDQGVWHPGQARKLLAYTKAAGGKIAAAELFNEPNLAAMGGAPKGYDAAAYGRDFQVFRSFFRKESGGAILLGPGSVGEAGLLAGGGPLATVRSEEMLKAGGKGVDVFSYHFYGTVSKRCASMGGANQTSPEAALSAEWLSRTSREAAFYEALRDRYEPGKPLWLTETGETACGGNPWASTFADSFRYLDQLGRLARRGVQVVAHNTLAASDYGLIDESTMTPRPNYWSALLWRKMMGTTVLDPGALPTGVALYAHCLRGHAGGVAVLAINTDSQATQEITLPRGADRYTLASAKGLLSSAVELNGTELRLGSGDALPEIKGRRIGAGTVALPPASITFFGIAGANNPACR